MLLLISVSVSHWSLAPFSRRKGALNFVYLQLRQFILSTATSHDKNYTSVRPKRKKARKKQKWRVIGWHYQGPHSRSKGNSAVKIVSVVTTHCPLDIAWCYLPQEIFTTAPGVKSHSHSLKTRRQDACSCFCSRITTYPRFINMASAGREHTT